LGYITPAAVTERVPSQDVVFAAAGLTPEAFLEGARYFRGGARKHTVVMSARPRVVRFRDTIHALAPEAGQRGFQL